MPRPSPHHSIRTARRGRRRGLAAAVIAAPLLAAPLLAGCGLFMSPPPPPPGLVPSPGVHNYGQVMVGTAPPSVEITWLNRSSQFVTVDTYITDPPGPFSADIAGAMPPDTVAAGARTDGMTFTFAPTAVGIFDAEGIPVQMRANPTVAADPVFLTGEGVAQQSSGYLVITTGRDLISGQVLDFGLVEVGGAEALREFRLFNLGNAPITFAGGLARGRPYILVSPTPPFAVPANGSIVVTVVFRPTAPGTYVDAIQFLDVVNRLNEAGTGLIGRAM